MGQSTIRAEEGGLALCRRQFKEAAELEHRKQELSEERKKLEEERRAFEREKQEFSLKKQLEENSIAQNKRLFDMKWKVLESELKKLAAEKEQIARQRDFYRCVNEFEDASCLESPVSIKGEAFFCGVDSEDTLKKRYKDLIKIYHPDNLCGDKNVLQEINAEYERLRALYE